MKTSNVNSPNKQNKEELRENEVCWRAKVLQKCYKLLSYKLLLFNNLIIKIKLF